MRLSELVCPICGYQFDTIEDRDEHEPCPENGVIEVYYITDSGTNDSPLVGPFATIEAAKAWIDEVTDRSHPNHADVDSFVIEEPITPDEAAIKITGRSGPARWSPGA